MGLIEPGLRLPLVPLSEASKEPVRKAMKAAGIEF
jgi:dihydrodipicolinate synthase/N-acetylneuraminate lyase